MVKPLTERDECHMVALKNGVEVDIADAPSGRGYFCIGCGREMQAVHFTPPHISYFRHHPNNIDKHLKCQWSDETYRHGVAKSILLSLKTLKVPSIKKFPPIGIKGAPKILKEKHWITAARAEQELYFFEDNEGNVRWQRHVADGEKCHNIVKPDIVFFDKADVPILFIELVATNKVSDEKRIKINRIGIDTVQVIVPKSSRIDIEKAFSTTTHTKWIFSHEEQRAKYVPVPEGSDEGLSEADREQRELYEENVSCWTAEIGNLVRSINRCLSSKQYRDTEQSIRDEIARIEREINQVDVELGRRREDLAVRISEEFVEKNRRIDRDEQSLREEQSKLNRQEIKDDIDFRQLETRYRTKVESIGAEEIEFARRLDDEEKALLDKIEQFDGTESRARDIFEQRRAEIERSIEAGEGSIRELQRKIDSLSKPGAVQNSPLIAELNETKRRTRAANERLRGLIEQQPGETEGLRAGIESRFKSARAELDARFSSKRAELDRRIKEGDFEGAAKLSERFARMLSIRGQLYAAEEAQRSHRRIRSAYNALKDGSFKTWINVR